MDVAGVVLGVVPVLVAAIGQYRKLYGLVKRFKKSDEAIIDLLECLGTHKLIFEHEVMILLTPVVSLKLARSMVQDGVHHPAWTDAATNQKLGRFLGSSEEVIWKLASRIVDKINQFVTELESANPPRLNKGKRLCTKCSFVLSESRFKHMEKEIRKSTDSFRVLREQILALAAPPPDIAKLMERTPPEQLLRIRATEAAASRVYPALAKACTAHSQHQVRLSLRPRYNSSSQRQEVKFKIAFCQSCRQLEDRYEWLVIESITYVSIAPPLRAIPAHPLKRCASPGPCASTRRNVESGKRVRFKDDSTSDLEPTSTDDRAPTYAKAMVTPDLTLVHNLCARLKDCADQNDANSWHCIGLLESSDDWRLPVFRSTNPSISNLYGTRALHSVSSQIALVGIYKDMPIMRRIQFAKLLSNAVLSFHGTPWMQSAWKSKDIILCDQFVRPNDTPEPELFIDVSIRDLASNKEETPMDSPLIPNATMYNLGVLLMEIAYGKTLQEMHAEDDSETSPPTYPAEYVTALRRVHGAPSLLGLRYSEIIKKCLRCDFGHGQDLRNHSLQEAVHRDVISELEGIETGLRMLEI